MKKERNKGGPLSCLTSDDWIASRVVPFDAKNATMSTRAAGRATAREASLPESNRDHNVQTDQEETYNTASKQEEEVSRGETRSVTGLNAPSSQLDLESDKVWLTMRTERKRTSVSKGSCSMLWGTKRLTVRREQGEANGHERR